MRALLIAASGYRSRQIAIDHFTSNYFRLFVDSNNLGGYTEIADITFLDEAGNDLFDTVGAAVTHSTAYSAATAGSKAIDGSLSSRWAGTSNFNQWLKFTFGQAVSVHGIEIVSLAPDMAQYTERAIRDFQLQTSEDGVNWTTVKTWVGETNWSPAEKRTYMF